MYNLLYNLFPLKALLAKLKISECELARRSAISRLTVRSLSRQFEGARLKTWAEAAEGLDYEVVLVSQSAKTQPDCSVQAVGYQVLLDGEDSWKIHFMNFVDEFRRTLDTRLIVLPPPRQLSQRLQALLGSMVSYLCHESEIAAPKWAERILPLADPWFVSESEALKPMMILETPLEFKRNLIFVGENFLDRA
ncbi:MAG: hypothetical protein IT288_14760 [Bdellovibrionales bacterium]|nr:hypothetical protein [Bdellovibrionales bacterium]